MKQLRWPAALTVGFALAIAVGIYFGDGETRVVSSHEFAFVRYEGCQDYPAHVDCSTVYIANADVIFPTLQSQDLNAFPPAARKVLTKSQPIVGLTWSPDGQRLAYLITNVAGGYPDSNTPVSYDLWTINSDGSGDRSIDSDVLEPWNGQHGIWFPRLTWNMYGTISADLRPVDPSVGRVDGAFVYGQNVAVDGELVAFLASGNDSTSICLTEGEFDRESRRCFGDGHFGTPVWRPY